MQADDLRHGMAAKHHTLFPHAMTIPEARLAIAGAEGFRETVKGDYTLFNYDFCFKGSFPDPSSAPDLATAYLWKVRRECRGLVFSTVTGQILSRRYHKFFNIGELPETEPHRIDLTRPHVVLEKMDGMLVAPLMTNNQIKLGSKAGVTDVSSTLEDDFLSTSKIDFVDFCRTWMTRGFTPMFEFCSTRQPIVINYAKDNLVLTGMRDNITGEYMPYQDMLASAQAHNVPCIKAKTFAKPVHDAAELVRLIKGEEGVEGYVLRFDDGVMYKIKSEWYINLHKGNRTYNMSEKDIWAMIIDGELDDTVYIPADKRERLNEFAKELLLALNRTARGIEAVVENAKKRGLKKKEFVFEMGAGSFPCPRPLYFAVFDGKQTAIKVVMQYIRDNLTSSSALDKIRPLAENLRWNGPDIRTVGGGLPAPGTDL
jgi:RNA ligase